MEPGQELVHCRISPKNTVEYWCFSGKGGSWMAFPPDSQGEFVLSQAFGEERVVLLVQKGKAEAELPNRRPYFYALAQRDEEGNITQWAVIPEAVKVWWNPPGHGA